MLGRHCYPAQVSCVPDRCWERPASCTRYRIIAAAIAFAGDSSAPRLLLAIGTPLNVQVLSDRSGLRLAARVLGMLEGESIMAHVPSAGFEPLELRLGDEVAVRCLSGRTVYGFKTTVVRVCVSPYPYFHLAFPGRVELVQVRQSERVAMFAPVTVGLASGEHVKAELRDLSATGALLVTPLELGTIDDIVQLEFDLALDDLRRSLKLCASIRNSGALYAGSGESARFRCGVQFEKPSEPDRLFLLGFVYERLASNRTAAGSELSPEAG